MSFERTTSLIVMLSYLAGLVAFSIPYFEFIFKKKKLAQTPQFIKLCTILFTTLGSIFGFIALASRKWFEPSSVMWETGILRPKDSIFTNFREICFSADPSHGYHPTECSSLCSSQPLISSFTHTVIAHGRGGCGTVNVGRFLFIIGVFTSSILFIFLLSSVWRILQRYYTQNDYRPVGADDDDSMDATAGSTSLLDGDDGDVSDNENEEEPQTFRTKAKNLLLPSSLVQFGNDVAEANGSDRMVHISVYMSIIACTCLVLSVIMFASWNVRSLKYDLSIGFMACVCACLSEGAAALMLMVQMYSAKAKQAKGAMSFGQDAVDVEEGRVYKDTVSLLADNEDTSLAFADGDLDLDQRS